jgi:hypothetical protein
MGFLKQIQRTEKNRLARWMYLRTEERSDQVRQESLLAQGFVIGTKPTTKGIAFKLFAHVVTNFVQQPETQIEVVGVRQQLSTQCAGEIQFKR